MKRFFSGAYAKFWNSLLTGAGVGAGGVLVLYLVSLTGAFPGPEPMEIREAVLGLWVALTAALGAALAANIEPAAKPADHPPANPES